MYLYLKNGPDEKNPSNGLLVVNALKKLSGGKAMIGDWSLGLATNRG